MRKQEFVVAAAPAVLPSASAIPQGYMKKAAELKPKKKDQIQIREHKAIKTDRPDLELFKKHQAQ